MQFYFSHVISVNVELCLCSIFNNPFGIEFKICHGNTANFNVITSKWNMLNNSCSIYFKYNIYPS